MLKKAGLVVAAVAASLVAVSPLAFASEGHHAPKTDISHSDFASKDGSGLLNLSGNNANVPVQVCNNDVPVNAGALVAQVPVKDLTGAITGAAALFGKASSSTDVVADNSRACGQVSGAGDVFEQ
ncbi:MAG: hypothetical protein OJJ54_15445 [Pseudonocardia sp.]|nr:hypothetical protein [Pseudonocardia sp.]